MPALLTDTADLDQAGHLPAIVLYTFRLKGQAAVVHHTLEQPDDASGGLVGFAPDAANRPVKTRRQGYFSGPSA
jgi:hypothetical protein